jgi:hypothetical protein
MWNKPGPWKTVIRIKWRNLLNHFVPTASTTCGANPENSDQNIIDTHETSVTFCVGSRWEECPNWADSSDWLSMSSGPIPLFPTRAFTFGCDNRSVTPPYSMALLLHKQTKNKQTPWSESASELYRPSDHRLSAKWLPTVADWGCHVVSVTCPYGRILGFLDRSRYFSIR